MKFCRYLLSIFCVIFPLIFFKHKILTHILFFKFYEYLMYLLIIGKFFNIYRKNSRSRIIALYYSTIRQVPFSSIIFQRTHTSLQPIAGKTRNHITKQYESHYRQENNMELSQLCFLIILLFLYNHMMQPTQPTSCSTTLKNQYNVPGKLHYLAAQ